MGETLVGQLHLIFCSYDQPCVFLKLPWCFTVFSPTSCAYMIHSCLFKFTVLIQCLTFLVLQIKLLPSP